MKVLVCGGHEEDDTEGGPNWNLVFETLDRIHAERGPITFIIQGGAKGFDFLGYRWCRERLGHWGKTVNADWRAYGRNAGPKRNQKMLNEEKPDLVVAFPGANGTADMVYRAKMAGVEVIEIKRDNPEAEEFI